jgi:hypothetical protein
LTNTLITLNQNAPTSMCRTPVVMRIICVWDIPRNKTGAGVEIE